MLQAELHRAAETGVPNSSGAKKRLSSLFVARYGMSSFHSSSLRDGAVKPVLILFFVISHLLQLLLHCKSATASSYMDLGTSISTPWPLIPRDQLAEAAVSGSFQARIPYASSIFILSSSLISTPYRCTDAPAPPFSVRTLRPLLKKGANSALPHWLFFVFVHTVALSFMVTRAFVYLEGSVYLLSASITRARWCGKVIRHAQADIRALFFTLGDMPYETRR